MLADADQKDSQGRGKKSLLSEWKKSAQKVFDRVDIIRDVGLALIVELDQRLAS